VDRLYFDLEHYKARENLYSLIICPHFIRGLLNDTRWYTLWVPAELMALTRYSNVAVWNQLALELLKKYCSRLFDFKRDEFIRPRLRVTNLDANHENLPKPGEVYTLTVDASEGQLIADIGKLQAEIAIAQKSKAQSQLIEVGNLKACILANHLYEPLISANRGAAITIAPVALNESETTFVTALMGWLEQHEAAVNAKGTLIYLLRNKSRGSGIGFFEAGNFYPDFILWAVTGTKQVVAFVEPHGISHEGQQHPKVQFHKTIKEIEARLGDVDLRLESAIVTPTYFVSVKDRGFTQQEWADNHVYFMSDRNAAGQAVFIESVMSLVGC